MTRHPLCAFGLGHNCVSASINEHQFANRAIDSSRGITYDTNLEVTGCHGGQREATGGHGKPRGTRRPTGGRGGQREAKGGQASKRRTTGCHKRPREAAVNHGMPRGTTRSSPDIGQESHTLNKTGKSLIRDRCLGKTKRHKTSQDVTKRHKTTQIDKKRHKTSQRTTRVHLRNNGRHKKTQNVTKRH